MKISEYEISISEHAKIKTENEKIEHSTVKFREVIADLQKQLGYPYIRVKTERSLRRSSSNKIRSKSRKRSPMDRNRLRSFSPRRQIRKRIRSRSPRGRRSRSRSWRMRSRTRSRPRFTPRRKIGTFNRRRRSPPFRRRTISRSANRRNNFRRRRGKWTIKWYCAFGNTCGTWIWM